MRIGIDVREFKKDVYTGLRTILRNFLNYVQKYGEHEFVFFGNQHTDFSSLPERGEKVLMRERNTFWWDQFQLPGALQRKKINVFLSPYIKTPLRRVCPYVNTVCDVIPLKVSRFKWVMAALEKTHFLVYTFICIRRSMKTITLSEDAKDRICRIFRIEKNRLKVAYPSVEIPRSFIEPDERADGFIKQYDLYRPYILYVGNFKPHKNLERLVAAFGLLPEDVKKDYRLMLVGGSGKEASETEKVIAGHGLSGRIITVKNIEHDDVYVFLRNASFFIFPSLVEGFGIPPVEAMATGVPVAASNLPPMTEVLGDAALFFDPYDPGDIARAMLRFLKESGLREEYIERGFKHVSLFNTKDQCNDIMEALEDAGAEKVLCISSEFPPVIGGIATQLFNLWSGLPGKRIIILTTMAQGRDPDLDTSLNVVRKTYPLGGSMLSRVVRTILLAWHVWRQNRLRNIRKNHCAQVISAGLAGLIMKKLNGVPYVVYTYSADILEFERNFITKWLMKRIFAGSEHIVANSNFTKAIAVEHRLAPEKKITVITPGVDISIFRPESGSGSIREKYNIPDKSKIMLTVSRLASRKGHENILRALPEVIRKYPGVVYVVAGEGSRRKSLENLVKELGLENKVIFAGELSGDALIFFYNACSLFIMVPRYIRERGDVEGFGTVFLEANACGKPVIAGMSGGVSEAVIDGETGILVDPENVEQIRDAVLLLLEDEEYAKKLGRKGLSRVRYEFSWESRAESLRKLI